MTRSRSRSAPSRCVVTRPARLVGPTPARSSLPNTTISACRTPTEDGSLRRARRTGARQGSPRGRLGLRLRYLRPEPDFVPVGVDVRPLAQPVRLQADGPGETTDARLAPFLEEGIGVAHVQVGRRGVVLRFEGQVDAEAVPVGEAVVGAALVGEGLESQRGVVGQRGGHVAHREDGTELTEAAGPWPLAGRARRRLGLYGGPRDESGAPRLHP